MMLCLAMLVSSTMLRWTVLTPSENNVTGNADVDDGNSDNHGDDDDDDDDVTENNVFDDDDDAMVMTMMTMTKLAITVRYESK